MTLADRETRYRVRICSPLSSNRRKSGVFGSRTALSMDGYVPGMPGKQDRFCDVAARLMHACLAAAVGIQSSTLHRVHIDGLRRAFYFVLFCQYSHFANIFSVSPFSLFHAGSKLCSLLSIYIPHGMPTISLEQDAAVAAHQRREGDEASFSSLTKAYWND